MIHVHLQLLALVAYSEMVKIALFGLVAHLDSTVEQLDLVVAKNLVVTDLQLVVIMYHDLVVMILYFDLVVVAHLD